MNDMLAQVMTFASVLSVFVLALVQLVKTSVNVKRNLLPVIGLFIGLFVGAVGFLFTDLSIIPRLWAGALAGLSSTGLFELAFKDRPGSTKE